VTWQDVEVHNDAPGSRSGDWSDPVTTGMTSRRAFLRGVAGLVGAAAAGAALTGCGIFDGGGGGPEQPDTPQSLLDFLAATSALADRYDATISEIPALTGALTPIRDAHRAHVRALADALGTTAPKSAPPATRPPSDGPSAMTALVAAEKAARDDAIAACLAAAPRYASLLGSIAAARATHLEVMT
jgi:sugar phosphate isomerase/epimerase